MNLPRVTVLMAGLLAVAPAALATANGNPAGVDAAAEAQMANIAEHLSRDADIPYPDAFAAVEDNGPLGDYVDRYWYSDEVGAVWATYADGYQVHARSVEKQNSDVLGLLKTELSGPLMIHEGGASLGALNRAADYLAMKAPTVPYNLNLQEGYVDLVRPVAIPPEIIEPRWVRVVEDLPVRGGEVLVSHAGLIWSGASNCSVGFTWKISASTYGTVTAAHCNDGNYSAYNEYSVVYGSTSSPFNYHERCPTQDIQYQSTTGGVGHLVRDYPSHSWSELYAIAGGYYIGQMSYTSGNATGSLWDTVIGFGNYVRPGGSDCPSSGTVNGLWVGNNVSYTDSGGTIALLYNLKLFLAGHISFGAAGIDGIGAWTGYVHIPVGAHICVATNPC